MKSIRCRLDCATWCEYFKSGECTSSVKCKYQTEHISVKFPGTIFMPTKEAWEKNASGTRPPDRREHRTPRKVG